jgi:hypothetical protein
VKMKLTIRMPNLPDDAPVEVTGLGIFQNHTETELTEEQRITYAAVTGRVLDDDLFVGTPEDQENAEVVTTPAPPPPRPVDPEPAEAPADTVKEGE